MFRWRLCPARQAIQVLSFRYIHLTTQMVKLRTTYSVQSSVSRLKISRLTAGAISLFQVRVTIKPGWLWSWTFGSLSGQTGQLVPTWQRELWENSVGASQDFALGWATRGWAITGISSMWRNILSRVDRRRCISCSWWTSFRLLRPHPPPLPAPATNAALPRAAPLPSPPSPAISTWPPHQCLHKTEG